MIIVLPRLLTSIKTTTYLLHIIKALVTIKKKKKKYFRGNWLAITQLQYYVLFIISMERIIKGEETKNKFDL